MQDVESVGGGIVTAGGKTSILCRATVTHPRKRCHRSTKRILDISVFALTIVAEPHHFYAALAPAPGKTFCPTQLYRKVTFLKPTKV
jgi:hypothetical protein